jgi:hypothetical protein
MQPLVSDQSRHLQAEVSRISIRKHPSPPQQLIVAVREAEGKGSSSNKAKQELEGLPSMHTNSMLHPSEKWVGLFEGLRAFYVKD